jgi:hypothetical protein
MSIRIRPATLVLPLVLAALNLPIQALAGDQVPFRASEAGTFQLLDPCETSGVVVDVTGTGHATQLGTYSAHYRECLDPATGAVTGGSFTLTAANGDTVFGTYGGQVFPTGEPTVIAFEDPGVVTGGTGRFASATGSINQSGLANLATGEYTATLSGSVSTPGSA